MNEKIDSFSQTMKTADNKGYDHSPSNTIENNNEKLQIKKTDVNLEELQSYPNVPTTTPSNTIKFGKSHRKLFKIIIYTLIHLLVICYFSFATYHYIAVEKRSYSSDHQYPDDGRCHVQCGMQFCNGYGFLLILLTIIYAGLFYYQIFKPKIGLKFYRACIVPFGKWWMRFSRTTLISILTIVILLVAFAICLFFQTRDEPEKLIGLIAPIIFLFAGYIFSTDRNAIKWRTVLTGIAIQFILAIVCIRWEFGRKFFECIGDKVATFLSFTNTGSLFVFGSQIVGDGVFAFVALPVIFFFSFCISILYYLGVMQWVVIKLGWILQKILNTTVCESVNAAANIFLGMSESPLLIRPYIKLLTASEMHAIMVSGFATVSGTVLAAYISFGASPAHLITSSVMAAPATLAISKLYLPETEKSKCTSKNMILETSEDSSLLDAASNGACAVIPIILGIIANIISFVAFIAFLNAIVNWLGYLVGLDDITFEWILSKLFIPLAWSMGIPWKYCDIVAEIIAKKTIINEFVAYKQLGVYTANGQLDARSVTIATFAICGFANPSSLGVLIGALSVMAPNRRTIITSVAFRSFIVGSIVCFTSASFAGILFENQIENNSNIYSNLSYQNNSTLVK